MNQKAAIDQIKQGVAHLLANYTDELDTNYPFACDLHELQDRLNQWTTKLETFTNPTDESLCMKVYIYANKLYFTRQKAELFGLHPEAAYVLVPSGRELREGFSLFTYRSFRTAQQAMTWVDYV